MKFKLSGSAFKKMMDKFGMLFGTYSLMFLSFLIGTKKIFNRILILGYNREYYLNFFSFILIFLLVIRTVRYIFKKWHFFMIDFCIMANILILLLINFYRENKTLWYVSFYYNFGPVVLAIINMNSSFVFHSLDK